jgi:hypothetical protein
VLVRKGFKVAFIKKLLRYEKKVDTLLNIDITALELDELESYQQQLRPVVNKISEIYDIYKARYNTSMIYLDPLFRQLNFFEGNEYQNYLEIMRTSEKEMVKEFEEFLEYGKQLWSTRIYRFYPVEVLVKMERDRLGPVKERVSEIASKLFALAHQYNDIGKEFLDKVPDLWIEEDELKSYTYVNLLLVECLRFAAIANRQEILRTRVLQ